MAAENLFLPADRCWGKNSLQGQCQNFPAKLEIFCPIPPLLMQNSSDLAHFEMKNHVFCIFFFKQKNIILFFALGLLKGSCTTNKKTPNLNFSTFPDLNMNMNF